MPENLKTINRFLSPFVEASNMNRALCSLTVFSALTMAVSSWAAVDNFDYGPGSLFGQSGGSASGGISWTGSWSDPFFGGSADVVAANIGTVNTVTSTENVASETLGRVEQTRTFTSQSDGVFYTYGLVRIDHSNDFPAGSFGGIGLFNGSDERFLIGQLFEGTNWAAVGSGLTGVSSGVTSSTAIGDGVTALLALKVDQVNNVATAWVNPDFSQVEGANTAVGTITWDAGADDTIDTIRLRAGDDDTGDTWYWDNVNVTGDTPFVPEPASLFLMGLGGLLMLRRRSA
jgi:hypothetical protein